MLGRVYKQVNADRGYIRWDAKSPPGVRREKRPTSDVRANGVRTSDEPPCNERRAAWCGRGGGEL